MTIATPVASRSPAIKERHMRTILGTLCRQVNSKHWLVTRAVPASSRLPEAVRWRPDAPARRPGTMGQVTGCRSSCRSCGPPRSSIRYRGRSILPPSPDNIASRRDSNHRSGNTSWRRCSNGDSLVGSDTGADPDSDCRRPHTRRWPDCTTDQPGSRRSCSRPCCNRRRRRSLYRPGNRRRLACRCRSQRNRCWRHTVSSRRDSIGRRCGRPQAARNSSFRDTAYSQPRSTRRSRFPRSGTSRHRSNNSSQAAFRTIPGSRRAMHGRC